MPEDPQKRLALPEFKTIPPAEPHELTPAATINTARFRSWSRSHGDSGSRRYSALDQINRENVKRLEVAWTDRSGDGAANIQCTPIVVDGLLIAPTAGRAMVALDAATGVEKWRISVEQATPPRPEGAPGRRGLAYWPGDRDHAGRVLFGAGNWIYAVDLKTGKAVAEFGGSRRTALPTGATTCGAIFKHVFVTTGVYGSIYGLDVRTGKKLWEFESVAGTAEAGMEPWNGRANGWSGLSVDEDRGIAYIAIGNPHPDMVGIGRPGDNLFSNCLLALDARTGRRLWHFQNVRHDIWDLDVTGAPVWSRLSGVDVASMPSPRLRKRERCCCSIASPESRFSVSNASRAGIDAAPRANGRLPAGPRIARADFPDGIQARGHHRSHS